MKSWKKNGLGNKALKIFFLPEVNHGIGHITRSTILAKQFEKEKIKCIFPKNGWSAVKQLIIHEKPDIVVFDLLNLPPDLDKLKGLGIFTAAIFDFITTSPINTNLVFNSHPGMKKYIRNSDKDFYGPKYAILDSLIQKNRDKFQVKKNCNSILITFGGSDPKKQTVTVYKALKNLSGCKKNFVLGPRVNYDFKESEMKDKNTLITKNINHTALASLMLTSDIAVSAAGNTMYELACLGVPSIIGCNHQRHFDAADEFAKNGAVLNLGITPDSKTIEKTVRELIKDVDKRKKMHDAARRLLDGKGTTRVVNIILEKYSQFKGISKSA